MHPYGLFVCSATNAGLFPCPKRWADREKPSHCCCHRQGTLFLFLAANQGSTRAADNDREPSCRASLMEFPGCDRRAFPYGVKCTDHVLSPSLGFPLALIRWMLCAVAVYRLVRKAA